MERKWQNWEGQVQSLYKETEEEPETSTEEGEHELVCFAKYTMDKVDHHSGTFGKESVPDGDPVGGVWGSGGTARLSSIIPLQLTGQRKHGYTAVICLGLPHAALCCTVLLLKSLKKK